MLKAIVFDFDGVIVDSEPMHFRAFAHVVKQYGIEIDYQQYLDRYIGYDDRDLIRIGLAELSSQVATELDQARLMQLIKEKAVAFEQILAEGIDLIPGVKPFIDEVSTRLPIAIASGASRQDINLVLDRLEMSERFATIVSADDVAASKPAPETYAKAVEEIALAHPNLDLQARDCLAIEDTSAGIASARSAGLLTLGLTTTSPVENLLQAHRLAKDFRGFSLDQLHEWFD